MSLKLIRNNFLESQQILDQFSNDDNFEVIQKVGDRLVGVINDGGKIISCGNGGSMCDAMHFAEELSGSFREKRKALPAISISDPSYISCVGNDFGYDEIFERFIEAFGKEDDALLAISTSGNSENVIKAAKVALKKGMTVIALTGKEGGKLAEYADLEIRAPYSLYADRIQEIHIKVIHTLIHYIEEYI